MTIPSNFTPCKFYVLQKKRNCRGIAKIPNEYCPEHSTLNQEQNCLKRIVCPIDKTHSVYKDKLAHHLKVCNASIPRSKPYYSEKINAGSDSEGENDFDNIKLNDVDVDEIKSLIAIIMNIKSNILQEINQIYDINKNPEKETEESMSLIYNIKNDKHNFQYLKLIEIMNSMHLLDCDYHSSDVFIEFGAGKGGFSHFIEKTLTNKSPSPLDSLTFLLIDKQGVRNRFDAKHKTGPKFERILMDISHLNLNKVDIIKGKNIFIISKHLCGVATDLTLRCIKNWITKENLTKDNIKERFRGLVIALCCHHKCDWKSYINKSWIREIGINPRQFHLMTLMTGWATCGNINNSKIDDILKECGATSKREIGLMCKRILDLGRKFFLEKEFGLDRVCLKSYIDQTVTLENCALFVY